MNILLRELSINFVIQKWSHRSVCIKAQKGNLEWFAMAFHIVL